MRRRFLVEALMIGTMIVRAIRLGDEIHWLYKVHKPKRAVGFTQPDRQRRFRSRRSRPSL
jgi:hypothetical protein